MNKYVEIVEHDSERVIKRYGVSLMSDAGADTVEDGANFEIQQKGLQNSHFVRRVKCETELETGKL